MYIFLPALDLKRTALAWLKLNDKNRKQIEILSREYCFCDFLCLDKTKKKEMLFSETLGILPHSGTWVMALENRASLALMSQKLLESI